MYLTKLILDNFQKHSHLELDFSKGVNILYGKTDVGKSCIIRAIRWVNFNEPTGDIVRKEGTKKTSVKEIFDNDIEIERIKTATTNAYRLTINGETKEYNAIGKNIPEDILNVTKMLPIEVENNKIILNVSNQLSLPFLLDQSATFRSKLFNKLTGSDKIDQLFQGFNKDILQIGRDKKSEEERLIELKNNLKVVEEEKNTTQKLYKSIKSIYDIIKEKTERYNKLKELSKNLTMTNGQLFETKNKISSIKLIPAELIKSIKQKITSFDNYVSLQKELRKINNELKEATNLLNNIIVPKINTIELRQKIDKLSTLQKLCQKLCSVDKTKKEYITKLAEIIPDLEELENKEKEILKSIEICPFHKVECPLNKGIK